MKKRWKIFWLICAVITCVGIGLCLTGLALGATLDDLASSEGWPLHYVKWEEEHSHERKETSVKETDTSESLSYTGVEKLDVEVGKAAVFVQEYDGTEVLVDASSLNDKQKFSCRQEGNELEIEIESKNVASNEGTLYITVPKGTVFAEASFDVGGGWLKIENITAGSLDISVGAGEVEVQRFQAEKLDAECGAGYAALTGTVSKEADLECGVGAMDVELGGRETDYDYSVQCGLGTITAGDSDYSGLSRKLVIDNGQNRSIKAECGIGTVDIEFTDEF